VQYLERWNAVSPNEYRYHLGKAIWHFARHRDLASALSEINKCRGSSDATWRYSAAFLESYRGDLTTASRIYEKAFTRPVDQLVPFEVEEFIQWVLQIEPDKVQLYYCLGLINLKMKHDLELALTDFRRFLEASEGMANFARARSEASQYIEQIEARLGHD